MADRCGGGGYEAYDINPAEGAIVVVRPDGYVGAFVHDAEGLHKYFSKVFLNA